MGVSFYRVNLKTIIVYKFYAIVQLHFSAILNWWPSAAVAKVNTVDFYDCFYVPVWAQTHFWDNQPSIKDISVHLRLSRKFSGRPIYENIANLLITMRMDSVLIWPNLSLHTSTSDAPRSLAESAYFYESWSLEDNVFLSS